MGPRITALVCQLIGHLWVARIAEAEAKGKSASRKITTRAEMVTAESSLTH